MGNQPRSEADRRRGSDVPHTDVGTAVSWEEREWAADHAGLGAMSRRQRMRARGPYRAAVPAGIVSLEIDLPPDVIAESEDALVAIARFDAELATALTALDETDVEGDGELAPLASVLLRTESASSSQIENVTAGAKALAMATLHERAGANAQLVAANVEAMRRAIEMSDALSSASIRAAHHALMAGHPYARPGGFRVAQVWIGGAAPTPHTADFVPPHAERVEAAIADLVAFCARTDIPVLTHAAIAHAQFETIHPFDDGNGRIGRVLVHAMLRRSGATRRMTVPVSAGLLTDTGSYFDALTAFREGDPSAIVDRFSLASFSAVANGRSLVSDLQRIQTTWRDSLSARRGAAAWKTLPMLMRQPAVTVQYVQEHAGVSRPAAQHAIDQLVEAAVLAPATANLRNRVWVADAVIDALDDFAARVGRRA